MGSGLTPSFQGLRMKNNQGKDRAQYNLAHIYDKGDGVSRD